MARIARFLTLLASLVATAAIAADTATILVDAAKVGPRPNPRMYGIFLEEINHGVDGGLYAEMIRNRGFEDSRAPEGYTLHNGHWVDPEGFDSGFSEFGYSTDGIPFWSLIQEDGARGSMHLETTGGITDASSYCLRLEADDLSTGRIGVANGGFFGIGVKEGERYLLSLYARGENFDGTLSAQLEDDSGNPCSDEVTIEDVGNGWSQSMATLTATKTEGKARLVVSMTSKGRVWLDFVSLFPQNTWKNRTNGLRPDIARMIADLKPGFVRFPGGCAVEGGTVETAYNWKLTVGRPEDRPERWGAWNYRRTHGMGLFEYLQFCEDLGAEPLWVGFCGQTCIFRQRENVPLAEMGWVRDNFLDIVDYANGLADSNWGSKRAHAGHPTPFGLKYVEIGNENQGREFFDRYQFVYEALKAKHPDLQYFADLSWTSPESMRDAAFNIEDHHYYNSSRWFMSRFHEYDERDRSLPPLYLGELAVTSDEAGPLRGNFLAALAEGVFLMGCERNADVVKMVSYAPLLAHVDGRTALTGAPPPWHAMIYFDGSRVFGTASYYLWKLFGNNRPDEMVAVKTTYPAAEPPRIAGQIGVGTWDANAEFKDIRVERDGQILYAANFATNAQGWETDQGSWTVKDGSYQQTRRGFGLSYFGDPKWTDYTLTLKARKATGGEGFLIVFGRHDAEKYWWNLGGWGNHQHAIELNQNIVGQPARGTIESNRWYDVKIELSGNRIRCYLDGQLIQDVISTPPEHFFAAAGRDDSSGEIIIKAINTAAEPFSSAIKVSGVERIAPDAAITVFSSAKLTDNNSLKQPHLVAPTESRIENAANEFSHEFPPYSLTILRLKPRQH
jgi:alpha-L-arabinofuranosidase